MAWRLELAEEAQRQLRRLDKAVSTRLLAFLQDRVMALTDPRDLGKAMQGRHGRWLYRVGDWRIVAQLDHPKQIVIALKLGHRGDVYRRR